MFTVLSSRRGHCESSPGSFDECRLSTRWLTTLKPSQPTWHVSLPVGCYNPPSPFISITHPKSLYSFYHFMKGGRLSQSRHCTKGVQPMLKVVYRVSSQNIPCQNVKQSKRPIIKTSPVKTYRRQWTNYCQRLHSVTDCAALINTDRDWEV